MRIRALFSEFVLIFYTNFFVIHAKIFNLFSNNELAKKGPQRNVNKALDLKADKLELSELNNKVNTLKAKVEQLQKALEFYADRVKRVSK